MYFFFLKKKFSASFTMIEYFFVYRNPKQKLTISPFPYSHPISNKMLCDNEYDKVTKHERLRFIL